MSSDTSPILASCCAKRGHPQTSTDSTMITSPLKAFCCSFECRRLWRHVFEPSLRTGLSGPRLPGSSVQRRGEKAQSDIDIFLVLPASGLDTAAVDIWERQTEVLADKITGWSGNRCEVVEMEAAELTAAVERDDLLVRDLRDQAVILAGRDPRDLLRKELLS